MIKIGLTILISMVVMMTSACNTVQGFGQDVQRGGEELEKAAS